MSNQRFNDQVDEGEAILCQNLRSTNDRNGNPRRLWASYALNGALVAIEDEGYVGKPSTMRHLPELPPVAIAPAEYRSWIKRGQS